MEIAFLQQMPVEAGFVIPFVPLAEFTSHKEQFFSRQGIHISEKQAQVGKFSPFISRHFSQQGRFTMDHFVMGKRHDKVLRKSIHGTKGELIVMKSSMNRIKPKV